MQNSFIKIVVFLILPLICSSSSLYAQSQKIFVKSLALESSVVVADLEGEVTFVEWDKEFVRVTATVQVLNFDEEMLKRLAVAGRYDLVSKLEEGGMYIRMPKLAKEIVIRGQKLEERVRYEIAVPQKTIVEIEKQTKQTEGM
jgi:hypothetical protein